MILALTIAVLIVAWAVRWLILRYGARISAGNAAAVAIVVAFAFGYTAAQRTGAGAAGSQAAAPGVADTSAAAVPLRPLPAAALAALHVAAGTTPGYVDGFHTGNSTTLEKSGAFDRTSKPRLSGWIVVPTKIPATSLIAVYDGKTRVDETSHYGNRRPDVAAYLQNDRSVNVGYDVPLPVASLAPGRHDVAIGAVEADGVTVDLLAPATFDVR